MNDLERYLDQASRGLPRRERQRVREELRSSILERAAEHQVSGVSESEALKLALREFGDPVPLGAGMRRIHLWPQVGFLSGLAAVTLSLVILNWPSALGQQVKVTTEGPVPRCTRGWQPSPGNLACNGNQTFWMELRSLQEQLSRQGVTLTPQTKTTRLPDTDRETVNVQETLLRATWQDGKRNGSFDIPVTANMEEMLAEERRAWARANIPEAKDSTFPQVEAVFKRGDITYLDAHFLVASIEASSNIPDILERPLDGPILRVLKLGQPGQHVVLGQPIQANVSRLLYQQYGATVHFGKNYLPRLDSSMALTSGYAQQTSVKGKPGEMYAVLFPVTVNRVNGLGFDVTTVDSNGKLHFRTAQPKVRFTKDVKALSNAGEGKAAVALLRLGNQITLGQKAPLWHPVEAPQHQ